MKWLTTLGVLMLVAAPAAAQNTWEWQPFEGEWEYETDGMEYEYDPYTTRFEVERDRELLPDEDVAEYYWNPPYGTEPPAVRSGRIPEPPGTGTLNYDFDATQVSYSFDEELKGRVLGLQEMRGAYGRPKKVLLRVRTDDGRTRSLELGEPGFTRRNLPRIEKGDTVVIGGERTEVDGRQVFRAREIRTGDQSYLIPRYQYDQRIVGQLIGLRSVALGNLGEAQGVVARVRTADGETRDVLLGRRDALQDNRDRIKPGSRIEVEGYERRVDGKRTFVVQHVTIRNGSQRGDQQQQQQQARQGQQQDGRFEQQQQQQGRRGQQQTGRFEQQQRDERQAGFREQPGDQRPAESQQAAPIAPMQQDDARQQREVDSRQQQQRPAAPLQQGERSSRQQKPQQTR